MARHPRGATATPDLTGRVVVVTGANSGLGKETAVALAGMGATVVATSRSPEKGERAVAEIRRRSGVGGDRVELGRLDLASLASVGRFAAEVLDRHTRLDVLVHNAGLVVGRRRVTVDGFEETIGVNHLGPFLLTSLLRDRLVASAPARVVTVSSVAHRVASAAALVTDLQSEAAYDQTGVYAKSKLANILFTRELARRLAGTGVTANCLHPGIVRSGFARQGDARGWLSVAATVGAPFMISARRGAMTTVHLASSPEVADMTGAYFVRGRVATPSLDARDDAAAEWLWQQSEHLVGGWVTS